VRITVAAAELHSHWHEAAKQRNVVDVPMTDGIEALSIDVLLGSAGAARIRVDSAYAVATMERGDGGTAAVIARPMSLDAPVREALGPQISQAVADSRQFGWNGTSPTRLVIFGGDADGFLRHIEIAVDPDADPQPTDTDA